MSPRKKINTYECVVPFCATKASSGFSKFPQTNPFRKQKWLEILEITFPVYPNDRVCHKHFEENQFCDFTSRRVLKKSALPSRHLPKHVQISFYEDFNLGLNIASENENSETFVPLNQIEEPMEIVPTFSVPNDHSYSLPSYVFDRLKEESSQLKREIVLKDRIIAEQNKTILSIQRKLWLSNQRWVKVEFLICCNFLMLCFCKIEIFC